MTVDWVLPENVYVFTNIPGFRLDSDSCVSFAGAHSCLGGETSSTVTLFIVVPFLWLSKKLDSREVTALPTGIKAPQTPNSLGLEVSILCNYKQTHIYVLCLFRNTTMFSNNEIPGKLNVNAPGFILGTVFQGRLPGFRGSHNNEILFHIRVKIHLVDGV